jgi:methyl-accepting chemotaxis protein
LDERITNKIQEMKEKVSGIEDMIEEINTSVKENVKAKKFLTQNIRNLVYHEKAKLKNNSNI